MIVRIRLSFFNILETTDDFDSATVRQLYNSIQESVIRREFKLQVYINDTAYVKYLNAAIMKKLNKNRWNLLLRVLLNQQIFSMLTRTLISMKLDFVKNNSFLTLYL